FRHLRDRAGRSELIERLDRERNLSDDHRHASTLLEHVAAETRQILNAEREIQLVVELEPLFLLLGENRIGDLKRVLRRERVLDRRVRYCAIDRELWAL